MYKCYPYDAGELQISILVNLKNNFKVMSLHCEFDQSRHEQQMA